MNNIKNILSICFLLFLFSCNTIKVPTYIGFENLKIETLNFNSSNLTVDVKYYNPNNFTLDVHKSDLNFYINDNLLAHSTQEFEIKIPKKGKFTIPLQIKLDNKTILKNSLNALLKKEVDIKATGSINLGKGSLHTNFPVYFVTKQPLSIF